MPHLSRQRVYAPLDVKDRLARGRLMEACSSYTKRLGFPVNPALALTGAFAQFNISIKSKLVILNLARLEQAADLHGTRTFLVLGVLGGLLAVLDEELGVVASELL